MKLVISTVISLAFFAVSCQQKEETDNRTAGPAIAASASDQTINEIKAEEEVEQDLQEASLDNLKTNIDDIRKLEGAARGSGGGEEFPDIASAANSLATHYDFEVKKLLESGNFREASFQWDNGELYYKRLAEQIANGNVGAEVGEAWGDYVKSRDELIKNRDVWATY